MESFFLECGCHPVDRGRPGTADFKGHLLRRFEDAQMFWWRWEDNLLWKTADLPWCDAESWNRKPQCYLICLAWSAPVSGVKAQCMSRVSLERSVSNMTRKKVSFVRAACIISALTLKTRICKLHLWEKQGLGFLGPRALWKLSNSKGVSLGCWRSWLKIAVAAEARSLVSTVSGRPCMRMLLRLLLFSWSSWW